MFDSLSTRLQDVFKSLRGEVRLTPENIEAALREIRLALLEADVNFKVVKAFIDRVRDRAMDQDGPQEPVAVAAGRQDRPRRDAGALRRCRRRPAATTHQAAARHPAARPAGRGQDDDRGQAGEVADEAGTPSAARLDRRQAAGGDSAAERRRRRRPACACTIRPARWIRSARAKGAVAEADERSGSTSSSSTPPAGCTSTTS